MGLNIGGVIVETLEELEATIASYDEVSKTAIRKQWNGESTYVEPTQLELDKAKYMKRAAVLNGMIAEMASENIGRVRSGLWTVEQLTGLTQDVQIKEILTDLVALSFEIAYGKIDAVTNPLITSDIKTAWKAKLAANF
jgi:hypothetical protein